jgi:hypothetical protein
MNERQGAEMLEKLIPDAKRRRIITHFVGRINGQVSRARKVSLITSKVVDAPDALFVFLDGGIRWSDKILIYLIAQEVTDYKYKPDGKTLGQVIPTSELTFVRDATAYMPISEMGLSADIWQRPPQEFTLPPRPDLRRVAELSVPKERPNLLRSTSRIHPGGEFPEF